MTLAPLPAEVGLGFEPQHFAAIAAGPAAVGFFEVHAENYFGAGGAPHAQLAALRRDYALSIHGVGLSIGGSGPLDKAHLARLKDLCERYQPQSFSEHLAWASHHETFFNDLLPLPLNQASLARVAAHVDELQSTLQRRVLIENPASYLELLGWHDSGTAIPRGACRPDRMRPATRHQQCLCQRHQSGLRSADLSRRLPARICRGNPSRRS